MTDTVTAPPKHVGVLVVCTQEEAELLAAITRGERDTYDTRSEVKVSRAEIERLEAIRLAAVAMIDWINSPNSQDLFDAVAKASGVHANHIMGLLAAFGRKDFEWADDEAFPNSYESRWLASPTREEGR